MVIDAMPDKDVFSLEAHFRDTVIHIMLGSIYSFSATAAWSDKAECRECLLEFQGNGDICLMLMPAALAAIHEHGQPVCNFDGSHRLAIMSNYGKFFDASVETQMWVSNRFLADGAAKYQSSHQRLPFFAHNTAPQAQ